MVSTISFYNTSLEKICSKYFKFILIVNIWILYQWFVNLINDIIKQILSSCSYVSSSALWLYHLDSNEMFRVKTRWELHKNARNKSWKQHPAKPQLCSPLTLNSQTNQVRQRRHAEHSWISKDKLISDVTQSVDSYTWTHQCWLTSKDLHTLTLCRNWMQSRGPTKRGCR